MNTGARITTSNWPTWQAHSSVILIVFIGAAIGMLTASFCSELPITPLLYLMFALALLSSSPLVGVLPASILAVMWTPRTLDQYLGISLYHSSFMLPGGAITTLIKGIWPADWLLLILVTIGTAKQGVPRWFGLWVIAFTPVVICAIGAASLWAGVVEYVRLPLVVIAVWGITRTPDAWKRTLYALTGALVGLDVIAIGRYLLDPSVGERLFTVGLGINTLATVSSIALPLTYACAMLGRKEPPAWWWMATAMEITVILLTGSRQGLVGLGIYFITLALWGNSRVRHSLWFFSPVLIFIIIKSLAGLRLISYGLDHKRLALWYGALQLWQLSPLLGHGPGSFGTLWPTVSTLPDIYNYYWHPHNLYLMVLSEVGLMGAVALALTFWQGFRKNRLASNSEAYKSVLFIRVAVVIFLSMELFDYTLWDYRIVFLVGIMLGLLASWSKNIGSALSYRMPGQ